MRILKKLLGEIDAKKCEISQFSYENLNEEYITNNADQVGWHTLSKNLSLTMFSISFFERFKSEINWNNIRLNMKMTTEFAHKFQKELGYKSWWKDERLHREDGPAVTYHDGSKHWYKHGDKHRFDGPAVINVDGGTNWYVRDKLHRLDGPAVTYIDRFGNSTFEWYICDNEINEVEFKDFSNV